MEMVGGDLGRKRVGFMVFGKDLEGGRGRFGTEF